MGHTQMMKEVEKEVLRLKDVIGDNDFLIMEVHWLIQNRINELNQKEELN